MCEKITVLSAIYLIISFLSFGLLLYGVFLFMGVLFARVNPTEFEDRGVKGDSLIFFSSFAKNKTLSKYRGKLRKCSSEQMNDDIISQIYICSLICDKKFDTVFNVAAQLNSLIQILNYKLRKKGYSQISVGIGMDYGRALMVKAGYSGSGLNDVIWMGDVVNSACHIANKAGRDGKKTLVVSSCIYSNLNEHNQNLLNATTIDWTTYYEGYVINTAMDEWYDEHCK